MHKHNIAEYFRIVNNSYGLYGLYDLYCMIDMTCMTCIVGDPKKSFTIY